MLLIGGVIGFLRRKEFQISDIAVSGTRAIDPNQIHDIAQKFISGNYALVIPKTNALIFSKSSMEKYLLDQFPGLRDTVVTFSERNHLLISVTEKRPAYLWCNETCWFVDQEGIIYDEAPEFSDGVFVKFKGRASDVPLNDADPRRGRFASTTDFTSIRILVETLQRIGVSVLGISYLDVGIIADAQPTGPGDVAIRTDLIKNISVNSDAVILTTQQVAMESLVQSINVLMGQDKFSEMVKTQGANLEYIDLRFEGKIYYKFKNVVQNPPAPLEVKR